VLTDDQAGLLAPADHLVSYGRSTKGTQVFVLFPFRQNQEQTLANGHRSATLWAIEFGGIKLPERFCLVRLPGGERLLIYKVRALHG